MLSGDSTRAVVSQRSCYKVGRDEGGGRRCDAYLNWSAGGGATSRETLSRERDSLQAERRGWLERAAAQRGELRGH